jgi:hypothetical protein
MSTPETGLPSTEGPTGPRTDARLQESRSDPEPSDHAREAAELVQKLTPAEQQHLAAAVVQSMDTPEQQRAAAEGVVRALPNEQREQLADSVLGRPDRVTRQHLWVHRRMDDGRRDLHIRHHGIRTDVSEESC